MSEYALESSRLTLPTSLFSDTLQNKVLVSDLNIKQIFKTTMYNTATPLTENDVPLAWSRLPPRIRNVKMAVRHQQQLLRDELRAKAEESLVPDGSIQSSANRETRRDLSGEEAHADVGMLSLIQRFASNLCNMDDHDARRKSWRQLIIGLLAIIAFFLSAAIKRKFSVANIARRGVGMVAPVQPQQPLTPPVKLEL